MLYLIRAPKNAQVQEIYARVNKIAQGAAMMTETDLTIDFYKACSNLIPNTVMEELIYKNLCEAGLPEHTDADREFARQIRESIENKSDTVAALLDKATDPAEKELYRKHLGDPLNDFIVPYHSSELAMAGSTDVGDVSWVCPTAQVNTACYASGTPGHSWQLVAQGKAPVAHAAMLQAGRVMAGTAIDLFESPELLEKAKAEHAGPGGRRLCLPHSGRCEAPSHGRQEVSFPLHFPAFSGESPLFFFFLLSRKHEMARCRFVLFAFAVAGNGTLCYNTIII